MHNGFFEDYEVACSARAYIVTLEGAYFHP